MTSFKHFRPRNKPHFISHPPPGDDHHEELNLDNPPPKTSSSLQTLDQNPMLPHPTNVRSRNLTHRRAIHSTKSFCAQPWPQYAHSHTIQSEARMDVDRSGGMSLNPWSREGKLPWKVGGCLRAERGGRMEDVGALPFKLW